MIPEPYSFLYFATKGESHGAGTGPVGFGGAGCPVAVADGLAGAGAAGLAGAGVAAAFGGVVTSEGGEGLVGVAVDVSDCTEPEGVDFTPPGVAGLSAVGFSFSGGGGVGILVSSGISDGADSDASCIQKNDNFYQLEPTVSTSDPELISAEIYVSRIQVPFDRLTRFKMQSLRKPH